MSDLRIDLNDGRTQYRPGEVVTGVARWSLDAPAQMIELSVAWTTRGKGNIDAETVESVRLSDPPINGEHPFALRLPEFPYSVSGRLVTVLWQLRLLAHPGGQAQANLTVSPTGCELVLGESPPSPSDIPSAPPADDAQTSA